MKNCSKEKILYDLYCNKLDSSINSIKKQRIKSEEIQKVEENNSKINEQNIEDDDNINKNLNIDHIINEKKQDESNKNQDQILPEVKINSGTQNLNKSHTNFYTLEDMHVGEKYV